MRTTRAATFGASTPSISQDSTEALYGVGFEYRFSPKIAGRLEWERFDFEDGIDLYSLGIVFFPGKQ